MEARYSQVVDHFLDSLGIIVKREVLDCGSESAVDQSASSKVVLQKAGLERTASRVVFIDELDGTCAVNVEAFVE